MRHSERCGRRTGKVEVRIEKAARPDRRDEAGSAAYGFTAGIP